MLRCGVKRHPSGDLGAEPVQQPIQDLWAVRPRRHPALVEIHFSNDAWPLEKPAKKKTPGFLQETGCLMAGCS